MDLLPGHATHRPHGSGLRGLSLKHIDAAETHEGRFGRMFKNLPAAGFSDGDLVLLAKAMKGDDEVKDGPDAEESHIPAAYTYLGQFIDHDITFDPSTFNQQKSDPDGIVNFRTPRFDLDNIYGRGPSDQPYLYDLTNLLLGEKFFIIDRNPKGRDLPRAAANAAGIQRAIIGDPRNDENVIVSQLQGMFFRFHNRVASLSPGDSFDDVQRKVRWHYQWLVIHDFLPRVVDRAVLDAISPAIADTSKDLAAHHPHLTFYRFRGAIMPVEFSVAAYRFGHSMVRPGYRVNEFTTPLRIFDHQNPTNGLNAFGEFPKSWCIDWQRFIDLGIGPNPETGEDRVQFAYKIDTSIVEPLTNLPKSVAGDEAVADPRLFSLAFRNLLRGRTLLLPSGQDVAQAMGVQPLTDAQILIGAAENDAPSEQDGARTITDVSPHFAGKCPLWTYVLAEARRSLFHPPANQALHKTQLGPVGGRIVAEVFLGLLMKDSTSFVHAPSPWAPDLGQGRNFSLADLLTIALEG
jgi:heme peroxidase